MRSRLWLFSRGYVRFDVNGRRFWSWPAASREYQHLLTARLEVRLRAWNIFLWIRRLEPWVAIAERAHPGPAIYDLTEGRWLA